MVGRLIRNANVIGLNDDVYRHEVRDPLADIRPDLNGHDIMRALELRPGPAVGEASRFLLDLRIEHGPLGRERATAELLGWAREHGITPPAADPTLSPESLSRTSCGLWPGSR